MAYTPLAQAQAQFIGKSQLSSGNMMGGYTPLSQAQQSYVSTNTGQQPTVKTIATTKPQPVSTQPSIFQNIQNTGQQLVKESQSVAQNIINDVKGIFTPAGGKPQPITMPKQDNSGKIQLTQAQQQAVGQLKPGQVIPNFQPQQNAASAQLQKNSNIFDIVFNALPTPVKKTVKQGEQDIQQLFPNTLKDIHSFGVDPLALKSNPTKAIGDAWESLKSSVTQEKENIQNLFQATTTSTKIGTGAKTVAGAGNILFSPITALFSGANDIPVLGGVAKLITLPFSLAGEGAADLSNKIIDELPISAQAKRDIKPGIAEIAALTAQLALGKASEVGARKASLVEKFGKEDAQTILDQAQRLANTQNKDLVHRVVNGTASQAEVAQYQTLAKAGKLKEFTQAGHAGFLPETTQGSIELTPQQAQAVVINSNIEKTPLGKELLKTSVEANQQGKSIQVDLEKGGEGALKTPGGVVAKNISLVEPKASIEAMDEARNGWNPGQKGQFDEALASNDKAAVEKMLPEVPEYYKTRMENRIMAITGKRPIGTTDEEVNNALQIIREPRREVEIKSTNELKRNPIGFRDAYIKKFGNEVNTDNARELFTGYQGHNANDFQNASAALSRIVLDHMLDTRKNMGNNTILITGGGPGSGKTNAISDKLPNRSEYPIVYDTTLSYKNDMKYVKKSLEKGYDVQLAYILRHPLAAWESGVLSRDRVVTENYHLDSHTQALKQIIQLHELYKDNPKVHFTLVDNTGPKGQAKEISIDNLKKIVYDEEQIRKQIYAKTETAYKNKQFEKQFGKNSKEYYKRFTEDRNNPADYQQSKSERPQGPKDALGNAPNEPVGTGKLKESTAYKKFVEQLKEEDPKRYEELKDNKVTYNTLNLEKDAENAMKLVEEDPEKAYRIAKGVESAPVGQTETAISIALANRAAVEKNYTLQADLEASRSLRQTRRGQEIVSERGRFNDNSPHKFIQQILSQRLSQIGRSVTSDLKEEMLKDKLTAKQAAVKVIDRQVENLQKKIRAQQRKEALTLDVQKFIDDLICK